MSVTLDTTQTIQTGPPLPSAEERALQYGDSETVESAGLSDFDGELGYLFAVDSDERLAAAEQQQTAPVVDPGPPAQTVTPSPPQTPPDTSQPTPPPAEQSQAAPAANEDVEVLRAQVAELQKVKEFSESEDYQQAKVVAEYLREDPVQFIKDYLPHAIDSIIAERSSESMFQQAQTPEDYAIQYADYKMKEKYADFTPDASEALVPGTRSHAYVTDQRKLQLEGLRVHNEYTQQQYQQQVAYQQQQQQAFTEACSELGITAEQAGLVAQRIQNYEPTFKDYYKAIVAYLQSTGQFADIVAPAPQPSATPQAQSGQQPQRLHDNSVPPPGVHSVPGASGAQNAVSNDLMEMFGPALY